MNGIRHVAEIQLYYGVGDVVGFTDGMVMVVYSERGEQLRLRSAPAVAVYANPYMEGPNLTERVCH